MSVVASQINLPSMLRGRGFKSVGRVDVRAETTIPQHHQQQQQQQSSAPSVRSTSLEFQVDENGARIHGSQYHDTSFASLNTLHIIPKPPRFVNDNDDDVSSSPPVFHVEDIRATNLALDYDSSSNSFVTGPSFERFSGHTGICRVLGSKKHPIGSYSLALGDLIRIGSVGVVVCEINSTNDKDKTARMSMAELRKLKEHYLSVPLGQICSTLQHTDDDSFAASTDEDDSTSSEEDEEDSSFCYICYDDSVDASNPLVAPCECKGDTKYVHLKCLMRWNNDDDDEGAQANASQVVAVSHPDGLDKCSVCKSIYKTSVTLPSGKSVSLVPERLEPPYVTLAVVTQHDSSSSSHRNNNSSNSTNTLLTNTHFQLSFKDLASSDVLTIGRATSNDMVLRYRTVSQLHAHVCFKNGKFLLTDASSSNGTMLYLKNRMSLPWGKSLVLKMGRTVLTMKAKKRWRWQKAKEGGQSFSSSSSSSEEEEEEVEENTVLTTPVLPSAMDRGTAAEPSVESLIENLRQTELPENNNISSGDNNNNSMHNNII